MQAESDMAVETGRERSVIPTVRVIICIVLLLCTAAAFGRFVPRPPVVDASAGFRLTAADIVSSQNVVVFVLDSPLNPSYVRGHHPAGPELASHGSMVARVLRSHANVAVVGLPAEDITGRAGKREFQHALGVCLAYARKNPEVRVVLNISLSLTSPDPEIISRLEDLSKAGVVIVAAAGNDASETPVYPAGHGSVVAVASSEEYGKSPHSNYGSHIDISASGEASLQELAFLPYGQTRKIIETRGTSYAAPRVSAALAYALQKRPDWSAAQARDFVLETALPIEDELYERGKLGAGYLDIARVKSEIHRPYFWLHRFLPYLVIALFASVSVLIVIIKKLPGLFLALLFWLGVAPAFFMIVLMLGRTLFAIRAGWLAGEGPYMSAALLSICGCMWFLRLRPRETLRALAPPAALGLLLGIAGAPYPIKGVFMTVLFPAATAFWERKVRGIISHIETVACESDEAELCEFLAGASEKHGDPRIKETIMNSLLTIPLEHSVPYLETLVEEGRHAKGAKQLIAALPEPEDDGADCPDDTYFFEKK